MPVRDTGLVLQKLNWAAASVALVVVGASTFTQPFGRTRDAVSEITAFAVAELTVASGCAALTSSGGPFSLLSAMATVGAANAFSMAVAGTVTGAGVLAVAS